MINHGSRNIYKNILYHLTRSVLSFKLNILTVKIRGVLVDNGFEQDEWCCSRVTFMYKKEQLDKFECIVRSTDIPVRRILLIATSMGLEMDFPEDTGANGELEGLPGDQTDEIISRLHDMTMENFAKLTPEEIHALKCVMVANQQAKFA